MKKKTLALILCAVLLLSILPMTGIAGTTPDAPVVTVVASKTEAVVGDEFTVTVSADKATGNALHLVMTYDSTLVECTTKTEDLPEAVYAAANGKVTMIVPDAADGELAELTFKVTANKTASAVFAFTTAKYAESLTAMDSNASDLTVEGVSVDLTALYTVKFFDGERQIGDTQYVEDSAFATAPTDPSKPGFTFQGWKAGESTTVLTAAQVNAAAVAADVSYTAVYEEDIYTVQFFKEGGTTLVETAQSLKYNEKAVAPTAPGKTGYTFKGWKVGSSTTVLTAAQVNAAAVTADVSYTAVYEVNVYTVQFFKEDGATLVETAQSVNYSEKAEAPTAPDKTGYTFKGWKVGDSTTVLTAAQVNAAAVEANVSYTAVYEVNVYTVQFFKEDGATLVETAQSVNYSEKAEAPTAPGKTGYAFKGWKVGDSTTVLTAAGVNAAAVEADVSYTAVYELDFTIRQDVDYIGGYVRVVVTGDCTGYTFNGSDMFKMADKTFAYIYQGTKVGDVTQAMTDSEAKALVAEATAVAEGHDLSGRKDLNDVNGSGKFDIADLRAVFNCQNARAEAFQTFPYADFIATCLRADVVDDSDYTVNAADMTAIIEALAEQSGALS